MIKTIIFDIGKVIVPFDFQRSYDRISRLTNYPAADIPKRLSKGDLVTRFECGQVAPHDFVRELTEILEIELDYEQFCDIWTSIFARETLVPENLILALRERYRMLVLSNTNAIHFEMMRNTFPIFNHFHDFILSFEVGALKPSPLIYQEAIRKAGCRPHECFYTDDIAEYVEAAKRAGIDAVQFQSSVQIEAELRARGVQWQQ
jgi:putative hydrolase of the HAD superfamily